MKNNRWTVFGICASLFLMSMLYRASSAVIATDLARDLGLSPKDLGLLGAVFFYTFALNQLPLGPVLDRIGSSRTMVALNLVGSAGALIFAQANDLTLGLVGRGLLGLGMSANMMGPLKLFTRWFRPQEFATVTGLLVSVGSMGSLLATSPLVILVELAGWRGAFSMLALLNLALTIVMALVVREAPEELGLALAYSPKSKGTGLSLLASARALVRDRSYWAISISAGLRYGVYASIQSLWAGPFLIIHLGLSEMTAGSMLLLLNIGFIAGAPLWGLFSDRILLSRKKAVIFGFAASGLAVLILANWPGSVSLTLLAGLMFFFGFFSSFGQLMYAHIKELMPGEMAGTAMGGVNFFVFAGAGVFLQGLGGVMGHAGGSLNADEGYVFAFMFCFAASLVALGIYALSRDSAVPGKPMGRKGPGLKKGVNKRTQSRTLGKNDQNAQ